LDEVDAPFDEANIGRFVNVLKEFLDSTKFIVVTHSKKTMTAADMIYGITMQESGVSRQVSVKFEEVDDRGNIIRRENKAA
jgi:chromosome segregation protein